MLSRNCASSRGLRADGNSLNTIEGGRRYLRRFAPCLFQCRGDPGIMASASDVLIGSKCRMQISRGRGGCTALSSAARQRSCKFRVSATSGRRAYPTRPAYRASRLARGADDYRAVSSASPSTARITGARSRRAFCSAIFCVTSSVSPALTSGASTGYAAHAQSCSTAPQYGLA